MNKRVLQREVKNEKGEIFREFSLRDEHSYKIGLNEGKQQTIKEVLKIIDEHKKKYTMGYCNLSCMKELKAQIEKELEERE